MKDYIKKIINDEFLDFSIKNCDNRIEHLRNKKVEMDNNQNLSQDEINDIKILLLDKGKWIIETFILLENLGEENENESFYHKRQLSNLVNDFTRLKNIERNNDKEFFEPSLEMYLNYDKVKDKHMLNKINRHLKEIDNYYKSDKVKDILQATKINKEYGFKLTEYLLEDIELEELYYISNVLSHNNTRLNKMVDKDKESDLYKYIFDILYKVFKQLQQNYTKLKKENNMN